MKRFFILMITLLAETAASLLLVMVFFGIFLVILGTQFPAGTLFETLTSKEEVPALTGRESTGDRSLKLFRKDREAGFNEYGPLAARLTNMNNNVRSKQASSIAWRSAKEGMSLYSNDAVQTYKRSSARIEFDEQSYIDMRENSLIIIRKLEKDFIDDQKRSFIVVADGEFRGRFLATKESPVYVELETPTAVARIKTTSAKGGGVDFKVKVRPNEGSTFVVFDGKAEIIAQGKTVELAANQETYVKVNSAPTAPRKLPKPVKLTAPTEKESFSYRKLTPKITFSWASLPNTAGYYFMLGTDPTFFKTLVEERVFKTSFTLGNLKAGKYFWRVCSLTGKDADIYSSTRSLKVRQDTAPPNLTVKFPGSVVRQPSASLSGKTESDTKIFVDGKRIEVATDGSFSHSLNLKLGVNPIVVEAVDSVGNITYKTKRITRKL